MSDLVKRLRELARGEHDNRTFGDEAADEIERLQDELKFAAETADNWQFKWGKVSEELKTVLAREAAGIARYDVKLDALEAEAAKLRNVAREVYWHLAYDWQSHLLGSPTPFDMSVFSPESKAMMTASELALFKALEALE